MIKTKNVWGPRYCPRCGAWPGVSCRSESGRRASLPHRERYPEGPPRTYGKNREKKLSLARERAANRPALDVSLRQTLEERMAAFRERR